MKKGDMVRRVTARGKFLTPPLRVKKVSGALVLCVNEKGYPYCYRKERMVILNSISIKVSEADFDTVRKGGKYIIHTATPAYTQVKKKLKKGDCLCIYCKKGILFKAIESIGARVKRRVKNQGYSSLNTKLTYKISFE